MLRDKSGESGENEDKAKNHTLSSSEVVTVPASQHDSESEGGIPWSRRLNPLKTNKVPPIPEERPPSKEKGANWISKLTFHWVHPILSVGFQRPLEQKDIWLVNPDRSIAVVESKFEAEFKRRVAKGSKNPLLGALFATFKKEFLWGAFCQLLTIIAQNGSPYILKYLIAFSDEAFTAQKSGAEGPPIGRGIGLVFGVTALQLVMTFGINHLLYFGTTVGGEARAVLMSQIFAKAMRISGRAKAGTAVNSARPPDHIKPDSEDEKKWYRKVLPNKKTKPAKGPSPPPGMPLPPTPGAAPSDEDESDGWSNGRIVNLMSTDTHRIDQASGFFHMAWGSPLSVLVTMALLLINLSYSALPGLGLLFLATPLLGKAIRSLFKRRFAISRITDQRVSLTSEILQAIRFVKFFGWETAFIGRIDKIRQKEIRSVQIVLAIRDGVQSVSMAIPVFASMLSFITYALTNNVLSPAPIFSSLSLFNNLRMPLNMLPMVGGQVVDAYASIKRIQEFLLAEEAVEESVMDAENAEAIVLQDATFTWERTKKNKSDPVNEQARPGTATPSTMTLVEPFQIPGLDLSIGRDELVGVIGGVGSGKTSLLAALAGDMRKTSGSVTFGASRAFCPQYAWLQNATVRDNITFGKKFDREWYDAVTDACALRADFEMLPNGDKTEIGERGITVSGGQKQRINIARAIYFNAEIVLMDDPLSAVDAHVGRHIMDQAICGLLAEKCRILATHQLHVLHRCDRIVWMDGGYVKAQGTYEDLMTKNEEFAQLMTLSSSSEEEHAESDGSEEESIHTPDVQEKLAKVETAKSATALMQEEERAVKAVSGEVYGAYLKSGGSILVGPFIIAMLAISQGANILTSLWLSWWTSNEYPLSTGEWIGIYAGLGGGQAITMFLFAVSISVFGTRASRVMFKRAMYSVLRAPMSFFDTTPLGRITNRFSKDVDVMDNSLTDSIRMYFLTLGQLLATFALILAYFWYFIAAIVPLIAVFLVAAYYYRASAREIKRHEAVLRSVVFSKFSEAIYGTSTIRAYGIQDHFLATIRERIDEFTGAYYLTFANQRWLSLRLDYIGVVMIFVLGMLVVTSRFTIDPSSGGLVLAYMLSIMGSFQFVVRQMAEVENDMNNTERVHHYGTKLEQEAPEKMSQVPDNWPQQGEIVFDHVQLRYRAGLPLVLKDVSVHVKGGERIGVVGRTGAGKSSIMQALFRLVELSGGSITIDGVNISTIGLHDLRSRLAIIPQDPTLFKGTVRSNLDPFDEHTDMQLWDALRKANLSGGEGGGSLGLDTAVEEEGMNFSLGQRQLMALARALVRDAKIIICDEATSSVDFATDQKVQETMEAFKGKTLLCIAHRLKTIVGYDRICVMDQGRVAELGPPLELFDQGGIFQSMCEKGGIRREDIAEKVSAVESKSG